MWIRTSHLELPRRVTAYYLLFGLAALVCIVVGVPSLVRAVVTSQAESTWLTRLGGAASEVAAEYRQHGASGVQPVLERLQQDEVLAWCAMVDAEGRYLAHSDSARVGEVAFEPTGAVAGWGDVRRVRFVDADSRVLYEYQTPVVQAGQTLGSLRLAVVERGGWSAAWTAGEYLPLALAGPGLVVVAGAVALRRLVKPIAGIEAQLRQAAASPADARDCLMPVRPRNAATLAWNRLLEEWRRDRPSSVDTRLNQALDNFRNRKAEQILNSLSDGVAVTDSEGRVTFANQALAALVGLAAENVVGSRMEACLKLDLSRKDHPLLDPSSTMREVVVEVGRLGDMAHGVLRVARHPLRSADATATGSHVWCLRDVTQQKLADQMRNQFVYSATHELRTPLANIKAYAETLSLTDVLDVEKQKEFCNTINAEASRLARFIDDLLSISRMQAGSLALERQPTDTERLLRDTAEKIRPQVAQKRMTFECRLPEKLPQLVVDKDKFTVALVNLLGNAVKYTPPGGRIMLTVEVASDQLQIHVEDTGYGISVEDLPKVFDKFFRSTDPRVQDETGSGLGLSLAHEVIRLHGGKLTVQSELNKGTRFTISLPVA